MITFIIGIVVLIVGGVIYGRISEKIMKPTDAQTPAVTQRDNVDFVPMKKWKNSLIELLNIAGTGPILGPLQGILFGPIAFLTIPIGCVLGGAFHDYMVGMISIRNKGGQMPDLVRRFLGRNLYYVYNFFICVLMLLVGAVFIYTPGDIFVVHILNGENTSANPVVWIVYGAIFVYYIIATLFPIDKIIGKIYPLFGAILLLSAVGVFVGLFVKGYPLTEIWNMSEGGFPYKANFIPIFFVTVTCGILSGFHSTQTTLISRTVSNEHEGRTTFYDMMIVEGFIAMIWAAAGMGALRLGLTNADGLWSSPAAVVGIISKDMLGTVGGIIAIIGVIILPITSGDTVLRALRVMIGDAMHIDQTKKKNALMLALVLFTVVAGVLVWAKTDANGFNTLWRYFSWGNGVICVFSLSVITMYMIKNRMPYFMGLIPASFYMYIVSSYILNAQIGFNIPMNISYIIAGVLSAAFAAFFIINANRSKKDSSRLSARTE